MQLSLFHEYYKCPHCGNPCTFSQLGHAYRWGWCDKCHSRLGRSLLPFVPDTVRSLRCIRLDMRRSLSCTTPRSPRARAISACLALLNSLEHRLIRRSV